MNILLSGGWGYGNLGDDAILIVSLSLITKRFPSASIILLSYDPDRTPPLDNKNVIKVVPSAHRVLFNKSAFKQLGTYDEVKDIHLYLVRRIIDKIQRTFDNVYIQREIIDVEKWNELENYFRVADLFIMSGGGYFNNWQESFQARCTELELAAQYNVPSYIVGQSLDSFKDFFKPRLRLVLSTCKKISVRDEVAVKVLKELHIDCIYSPDLVLSHQEKRTVLQNEIVFIPATLNPLNRVEVAKGITEISKKYNLKINLIITRLYIGDINEAQWFYTFFRNNNVVVSMNIPNNINDVIKNISNKRYILSRNLHGLILGLVYGGEKLLCLNNQPKFISFMKQIGQSEYIVDLNTISSSELVEIFGRLVFNESSLCEIKKELANDVSNSFNNLFN